TEVLQLTATSKVTNPQSPTPNPQSEACFLKALEIARWQGAKSLELRAVMSLSRLWQQRWQISHEKGTFSLLSASARVLLIWSLEICAVSAPAPGRRCDRQRRRGIFSPPKVNPTGQSSTATELDLAGNKRTVLLSPSP